MRGILSSPMAIRSQLGSDDEDDGSGGDGNDTGGKTRNDSDAENQDPVSQMAFATQLPMCESPWKVTNRDTAKDHSSRHLESTITFNQDSQKLNAALSSTKNIASTPKVEPVTAATSAPAPTTEATEITSTEGDLTQQQIYVPSSSVIPAKPDISLATQSTTTTSAGATIPKWDTYGMPEIVKNLLQGFRKESHNGKYIPRRLQVIPKDQEELLKSDNRWQPALVGRDQRTGTVPFDLSSKLIKEADDRKKMQDALVEEMAAPIKLPALPVVISEEVQRMIDEDEELVSECESEDDQCSWSSSPPRPQLSNPLLPPDSSPLRDNAGVLDFELNKTHVAGSSLEQQIAAPDVSDLGGIRGNKIASTSTPQDVDNDSDGDTGGNMDELDDGDEGSDIEVAMLPSSTLPKSSAARSVIVPKTIQVKRTPFVGKESLLDHDDGDDDLSNTIIPGTFDERQTKRAITHSNDAELFEADSSEDEVRVMQNHTTSSAHCGPNPTTRLISVEQLPYNATQATTGSNREAIRKAMMHPSAKRKHAQTVVEAERSSISPKRMKTGLHNRSLPNTTAPSTGYEVIDNDRTRFRREYLGMIGEKRGRASTSIVPRAIEDLQTLSTASHTSPTSNGVAAAARTSSPAVQKETRAYHQPPLMSRVPSSFGDSIRDSPSTHPSTKSHTATTSFDLYNSFKTTYPQYDGQPVHFEAAFRLLKILHSQGKATHPSLWDDFIFRHYHDYREYLQEIIDVCGNAIPYEKFYDDHVEQPTCLRRVVKPVHVNMMEVNFRASITSDVARISARYRLSGSDALGIPDSYAVAEPVMRISRGVVTSTRQSSPQVVATEINTYHPSSQGDIRPDTTAAFRTSDVVAENEIEQEQEEQPQEEKSKEKEIQTDHDKMEDIIAGEREQEQEQENEDEYNNAPAPNNHKSTSRTSVNLWLERAAGAESPILGTPEVEAPPAPSAPSALEPASTARADITSAFTSTSHLNNDNNKDNVPATQTRDIPPLHLAAQQQNETNGASWRKSVINGSSTPQSVNVLPRLPPMNSSISLSSSSTPFSPSLSSSSSKRKRRLLPWQTEKEIGTTTTEETTVPSPLSPDAATKSQTLKDGIFHVPSLPSSSLPIKTAERPVLVNTTTTATSHPDAWKLDPRQLERGASSPIDERGSRYRSKDKSSPRPLEPSSSTSSTTTTTTARAVLKVASTASVVVTKTTNNNTGEHLQLQHSQPKTHPAPLRSDTKSSSLPPSASARPASSRASVTNPTVPTASPAITTTTNSATHGLHPSQKQKQEHTKAQQELQPSPTTSFQLFARAYSQLPSEKNALSLGFFEHRDNNSSSGAPENKNNNNTNQRETSDGVERGSGGGGGDDIPRWKKPTLTRRRTGRQNRDGNSNALSNIDIFSWRA